MCEKIIPEIMITNEEWQEKDFKSTQLNVNLEIVLLMKENKKRINMYKNK